MTTDLEETPVSRDDRTVCVFAPLVYDATHSRKHSMALAAAKLGYRTIYVERPSSKSPYAVGGGRPALNRPGAPVPGPDGVEVLAVPKKWVVGPIRFAPGAGAAERGRARWLEAALAEAAGEAGLIGIVTTARWWPAIRDLPFSALVYDKNDEPEVLKGPLTKAEFLRREAELLTRTDLLIGPSSAILEDARKVAPDVPHTLIRNGVEWDAFEARKNDPVPELEGVEAPVVGFLGTVAGWIDVDLIAEAARANQKARFPVIGPVTSGADVAALEALPNVELWGRVPFTRVPSLMNRFDVCLIPFKEGPISDSACPVKFFEYLSLGKPIVCTPMPELNEFAELFTMTRDGFAEAVRVAIAEDDPALAARRREAGREFGWDRLLDRLVSAIPELPRRSE